MFAVGLNTAFPQIKLSFFYVNSIIIYMNVLLL